MAKAPLNNARLTPAQQLVVTFVGAIALGTVLLALPQASATGNAIHMVDALFTATSATCVTGLVVLDTPNAFSGFGLGVILALIQVGGLGIMTFSLIFAQMLGRRADLNQQEVLQQEGIGGLRSITEVLRDVALWVFGVETLGAALLLLYYRSQDMVGAEAFSHAIFTSVSAFCNAGFALESTSLERHVDSLYFNVVIAALIILGGLGFGVLSEVQTFLSRWMRAKWSGRWEGRPFRFSYHARLVFLVTGVLLVGGTLIFYFTEQGAVLRGVGRGGALLRAAFLSVTSRTAGFNTVPIGALSKAGIFVMIILMAIGASPGGTGGGFKTTTLAILYASMRQQVRGEPSVTFWGRQISDAQVQKAIGLAFSFMLFFLVGAFGLLVTESFRMDQILFETMSALGTVGLTMGITAQLSTGGKLIVTVLMLAGRLGPVTLVLGLGLARKPTGGTIRYATENVIIG